MITQLKTEQNQIIDIEDVEYFYIVHKQYQYGLILKAQIKKGLYTIQSSYSKEADQYGFVRRKYDNLGGSYYIRIKDEPKLRNKIYSLIEKYGDVYTRKVGVNAGTPIAQSWTITDKRLSGEKVLELINEVKEE